MSGGGDSKSFSDLDMLAHAAFVATMTVRYDYIEPTSVRPMQRGGPLCAVIRKRLSGCKDLKMVTARALELIILGENLKIISRHEVSYYTMKVYAEFVPKELVDARNGNLIITLFQYICTNDMVKHIVGFYGLKNWREWAVGDFQEEYENALKRKRYIDEKVVGPALLQRYQKFAEKSSEVAV